MVNLTPNGIVCLLNGKVSEVLPFLQIMEIKKMTAQSSKGTKDRYRVILSDGQFAFQAIANPSLHRHFEDETIRPYCIVQIKSMHLNDMPNGKKLLVLTNLEVNGYQDGILGDPQMYNPNQAAKPQTTTMTTTTPQTTTNVPVSNYGNPSPVTNTYNNNPNPTSTMAMNNSVPLRQNNSVQNNTYGGNVIQQNNANRVTATTNFSKPADSFATAKTVTTDDTLSLIDLPKVRSCEVSGTMPIVSLTSFTYGWKIKARITSKSTVKTWDRGPLNNGCLFTVDLLDEAGGEIQGTFFKEAVEKFYNALQQDSVYTFSGGSIKYANERSLRFSRIKNQYQISFNERTDIEEVTDDNQIQCLKAHFITIDQIQQRNIGDMIDVIGVVLSHGSVGSVNLPKGSRSRRPLTIIDSSNHTIELTLWGDHAEQDPGYKHHPIIACGGCRIGEWSGKSLSTSFNSQVHINPDIPETEALASWYANSYDQTNVTKLTNSTGGSGKMQTRYLQAVDASSETLLQLGTPKDEHQWSSVEGSVIYIRPDKPYYLACPDDKCNKKVVPSGGEFSCLGCGKPTTDPTAKYILSVKLADQTGTIWASVYGKEGENLLKISANQLRQMQEMENDKEYNNTLSAASFKPLKMTIIARVNEFNGERRVKFAVTRIDEVDYIESSARMIDQLQKYELMA